LVFLVPVCTHCIITYNACIVYSHVTWHPLGECSFFSRLLYQAQRQNAYTEQTEQTGFGCECLQQQSSRTPVPSTFLCCAQQQTAWPIWPLGTSQTVPHATDCCPTLRNPVQEW
jgi:hypothetical protein